MATAVRSLAAGRTKFVILTAPPVDPKAPTLAELAAGVDASCRVKGSTFKCSPADSEKVDSDLLCEDIKSQALGQSNFVWEFDPYRYFDPATGQAETGTGGDIADAVFQLVKEKGARLYGYVRRTSKKSTEAFAGGDEVFYVAGANDWPQYPDAADGYWSTHVVMTVDAAEPNAVVAGTAPAAWAATTAYAVNDLVTVTGGTLKCTTAGTSGSTEPALPGAVGGTVSDGTVTWTRQS